MNADFAALKATVADVIYAVASGAIEPTNQTGARTIQALISAADAVYQNGEYQRQIALPIPPNG